MRGDKVSDKSGGEEVGRVNLSLLRLKPPLVMGQMLRQRGEISWLALGGAELEILKGA